MKPELDGKSDVVVQHPSVSPQNASVLHAPNTVAASSVPYQPAPTYPSAAEMPLNGGQQLPRAEMGTGVQGSGAATVYHHQVPVYQEAQGAWPR